MAPSLGWFGEDIVDGAREGLNTAGEWVSDAVAEGWDLVDDIPGLRELGEGVKAIATSEEFRDFAKSSHGQLFFRAIATAGGQGVGQFLFSAVGLGPLVSLGMASAHALPGVIRGQKFGDAFLAENMRRVEETAKIVGADLAEALPADWQAALDELERRAREFAPDLEPAEALERLAAHLGIDPEEFARGVAAKLGIREDMAGNALSLILDRPVIVIDDYDPATGKKRGAPAPMRFVARSRSASMRNEQIDRVFAALDPARDFRLAARAPSVSVRNTSPSLDLVRALRSSSGEAEPDRLVPIPDVGAPAPGSSPLVVGGIVGAGALGAWLLWRYL